MPAARSPTNLTARVKGTKLEVNLSWRDNATTETRYVVQRCPESGSTNFISIAFLPTNYVKFTDQGV